MAIEAFKKRIRDKEIKIAVVGLGYVGLPLALEFAKVGIKVLGVEVDKDRLRHIKKKESYITDVPTKELRKVLSTGRFTAADNFSCLKDVDVVLVCVPTPIKRRFCPDISFIKQAVESVTKNIKKGALIILESTTYPGTTEKVILPMFGKEGLVHNEDFYLCFSPERIDPGNKRFPVNKIPKIVGGISPEAASLAVLVYMHIIEKVVPVSSTRAAEAEKLVENTFRLVNIALIDELAMLCHRMDIDIWEVIEAAKTKPFGFMPFYPGPGCGGHCIPKDPLYLYWEARHHGFSSRFIRLASEIITYMPLYITERVIDLLNKMGKGLRNARVLAIGVTYKRDVKDLRRSPALDMIESFQEKGINVSYYDPLIPYLRYNRMDLKPIRLTKQELGRFDCVVIATDHSTIDYDFILENSKLIFDARNVFKGVSDRKVVRL